MRVSVLIPAYRPTFLRQAIGSVLAQGHEDYELLISDDSPGSEVEAIVREFGDRRIRYMKTGGNQGSMENCRGLWGAAQTPLVKFLLDDDLLMPHALVEMLAALEAFPGSSFCYSNRFIIDATGRVTSEPKSIPEGRVEAVPHEALVGFMATNIVNPVGEFSNVLINRASGVEFSDLERFHGFDMEMIADAIFYLNATERAPAVRVGKTLAAFRKHGSQNSALGFNPKFARGIFEWEIVLRCEFDAGRITREQALAGATKLENAYGSWHGKLPALEMLLPGLTRFRSELAEGSARGVTPEFAARIAAINAELDARWQAERRL